MFVFCLNGVKIFERCLNNVYIDNFHILFMCFLIFNNKYKKAIEGRLKGGYRI